MITIFTPTYNRGSLLNKLYMSLIKQTNQNFEWVIVDDGSTDNTDNIVQGFIKESKLNITYEKQTNGGKHTAINKGLQLAKGEYFFIVDSDDWLTNNSIQTIYKWMETIKDDNAFIGVGGRKTHPNEMLGTTFNGEYLDCKATEREKNNITGDKAEVYKTKILKRYPFPVFEGEKFLSESVVWNKISLDGYKIRWFNEDIYYCNYLEGGLTMTRGKFYKNYQGFMEFVKINLQCKELPLKQRIKDFVICCVYAKKKKYDYKTLARQLDKNLIIVFICANLGSIIYKLLGGSVG